MQTSAIVLPIDQLTRLGLSLSNRIYYQLPPGELVRDSLRMGQGVLSDTGALVINTGEFTGRSPKDRFVVRDETTRSVINWNEFNIPIDAGYYNIIYKKVIEYFNDQPELWMRDCYACADPRYRLNIRVLTERPAINLFACNMFLRPTEKDLEDFIPEWHILAAPGLHLDPEECGIRQKNVMVINFKHRTILVAGTGYTGEIKKGVFYVLNYLLPHTQSILSMHCSANMGEGGDTALFFGLSGTGKTTLSADPSRQLIGDDEHGWTSDSIFNFEGGCYAKTIGLDEEKEPGIFRAIRQGALLENTVFFPGTDRVNFADKSITENTRVSYPLDHIDNALYPSIGPVPRNIFFLTCDAYGVLPPVSRLSPEQAKYHFITGYTAKIAGTETGISEPASTFSACFGAPFLPLHPGKYAALFGEKITKNKVKVWLINTGWTGGPFSVGSRIKLSYTRAMITAALKGNLNGIEYEKHPVFGMEMPVACPGVPAALLHPRNTWKNKALYDVKASQLAQKFVQNFMKYAPGVEESVFAAGPCMA